MAAGQRTSSCNLRNDCFNIGSHKQNDIAILESYYRPIT